MSADVPSNVETKLAMAMILVLSAVGLLVAPASATPTSSITTTVPQTDASGAVWLCRPGLTTDPCAGNISSTSVTARNQRTVTNQRAEGDKRFTCFYVYPTISPEQIVNSDLTVQPAETAVATAQSARFSRDCDVWAPMYHQITVHGLLTGEEGAAVVSTAYASVLSAWTDFIHHYDHGRPIVFIGHSQGSVMLIKLLQTQIDPNPRLRRLVVSAILAGGNVTVPTGTMVGATFKHLPLCTRTSEAGCVIAYSSYPSDPPLDSLFGRPGQGVSLLAGQTTTTGVHVACVNPASVGGGTAELSPYFTAAAFSFLPAQMLPAPIVTTPWVTYPHMFSATCESRGGATWLQVAHSGPSSDVRPMPTEPLGETWGYHLDDISFGLGNLVRDVRAEEAAYGSRH